METPHTPLDLDRVMDAVAEGNGIGFCLTCGAEADNIEPDARQYRCTECGAMAVYGAEEVLIMGAAS